ncbi:hypothetical protein [Lysobacter terrae]
MRSLEYEESLGVSRWSGIGLSAGNEFDEFLSNGVAERLHDKTGLLDFSNHLSGLATTGFALESLEAILNAEYEEERDWAAGEALAEAWLSLDHGVVWPWNMALDKRTPKASLPGPDLIGFITVDGKVRLVLGEVKSSSQGISPPGVMTGRTGMTHQLEELAQDLGLLFTLLRWLHVRCNSDSTRELFNSAVAVFISSGNKEISLFGVLVRDTQPNVLDLRGRGTHLSSIVDGPTQCSLIALYLPCPIAELTQALSTGGIP